jgi:BlaI family transcriptional regulator, penicillinase repressor
MRVIWDPRHRPSRRVSIEDFSFDTPITRVIDYTRNQSPMPNPPAISDAEWEVMNVVWSAPAPLTANDVVERLARRRGWSPRTVKTMLNRLVKKGALGFEVEGKRYLYEPRVRRDECVRAESRSFLSRVFGGAAGPMLAHMVREADLSPADVEQLRRILADKDHHKGNDKGNDKGKQP